MAEAATRLAFSQQIKVWRATGMNVEMSAKEVAHLDDLHREFLSGVEVMLEDAVQQKREARRWALWQWVAAGINMMVALFLLWI